MDNIFKNNKIMGIVAVATLVLAACVAYQNYKITKALVAAPTEEEAE